MTPCREVILVVSKSHMAQTCSYSFIIGPSNVMGRDLLPCHLVGQLQLLIFFFPVSLFSKQIVLPGSGLRPCILLLIIL